MYQAPRGTQDILPDDAPSWQYVEDEACRQARLAGYREVRTPTFESTAVFQRGVGAATDIVEKEMYTFLDKGGESMTLRPEGTAGVVRAYLQRGMASLPQPVKLYSLLNLFRYDRPQKGRLREFHQFNIEAIGEADPLLDAELVALQWRFYQQLGLKDLSLHLNSVGDGRCGPAYVEALRAYFTRHADELCEDCQRRLPTAPLRLLDDKTPTCQPLLEAAPRSVDHLCQPCQEHFLGWTGYLDAIGLTYVLDHRLVRGLDYYTRSVWEVWPPSAGAQSALGGGGRYDGLAEQLGGRHTPGVGFATGIERIILALHEQGVEIPAISGPTAYVAAQGAAAKRQAFGLAEQLRGWGIRTEVAAGERKLGKQLAAADRSGAQYAVILGEDELARGVVTLKDLRGGAEQRSMTPDELIASLSSEGGLL